MATSPVREALSTLKDHVETQNSWWHDCYRKDVNRRNELATQASDDHHRRTEELYSMYANGAVVNTICDKLRENRNHARSWEGQFAQWKQEAEFDNEMAEFVHGQAKKWYIDCLNILNDFQIEPQPGMAVSSLVLLFGTDGKSDGRYVRKVKFTEGYECNFEMNGELAAKVFAEAEAGGKIFVAKVKAKVGGEVSGKVSSANAYKRTRSMEAAMDITVNLGKSCYVYQMTTSVPLNHGNAVQLFGGILTTGQQINV